MSELNLPQYSAVIHELDGHVQSIESNVGLEEFKLSAIPQLFKSLGQSVLSALQVSRGFTDLDKIPPLPKDQQKFLKLVKSLPYTSISDLSGFCPEGLVKPYLEYLRALEDVTDRTSHLIADTLVPYEQFLARFASDHLFSQDAATDKKRLDGLEQTMLKDNTKLATFFKKNSHEGRAEIKKLVARNGDWEPVMQSLAVCIRNVERVKLDEVKSRVKNCTDIIEVILREFNKPGTDRKVSQEAALRMGRHASVVAKELEHFSATYYRVLSMRGALEKTMGQITRLMEE